MVAASALLLALSAVSAVVATPAPPKCNVGLDIIAPGKPAAHPALHKAMKKCRTHACAPNVPAKRQNAAYMNCIHDWAHSTFKKGQDIKKQKQNPPRQCVLKMDADHVPAGKQRQSWEKAINACKREYCDKRTYVFPNRNFIMCVAEYHKSHKTHPGNPHSHSQPHSDSDNGSYEPEPEPYLPPSPYAGQDEGSEECDEDAE